MQSSHNLMIRRFIRRPVGLMDKALASGAGDSRFESWAGQKHAYLCPLSFWPLFLMAHGYSMAIASGHFHILFGPFLAAWEKHPPPKPKVPGSSPPPGRVQAQPGLVLQRFPNIRKDHQLARWPNG